MHLRKSDEMLRSGLPLDAVTKNGEREQSSRDVASNNVAASSCDKMEIPIKEQELDMVLDTLLASWILLVQRYQRDAFHRFTWGMAQSGQDVQCIESERLELSKLETADELLPVVRDAISKETSGLKELSGIFFNDGSADEVSSNPCNYTKVC